MDNLYVVEFDKEEYKPIIKIITENKIKIKRTLINDDDIELIIYCENKSIDLIRSKYVEITPYELKRKSKI
jgi:hypothetical protein